MKENRLVELFIGMVGCIGLAVIMYFAMQYVENCFLQSNMAPILSEEGLRQIYETTFFFLPKSSLLYAIGIKMIRYAMVAGTPIAMLGIGVIVGGVCALIVLGIFCFV